MSITLKNVSFLYDPYDQQMRPAVRNVSIRIEAGETVAIIGPTGSGKSTLVQLMAGLIRPCAGQVLIDDMDLWESKIERRRLRLQVGMVFQYPEQQLFAATVAEEVAFGPQNLGLPPGLVQKRVNDAIKMVGLDTTVLERSPHQLSGGQKRRVALASILAMQPRILILDEATAGLDPIGRENLLNLLHRLIQEGLTVIFVSHNMDEVAQLARRVVVLHEGEVVMDGPIRSVFSQDDRLQDLGLDVPIAAKVVLSLAKCGWPIRTGVLTVDEAVAAIVEAVSKT